MIVSWAFAMLSSISRSRFKSEQERDEEVALVSIITVARFSVIARRAFQLSKTLDFILKPCP